MPIDPRVQDLYLKAYAHGLKRVPTRNADITGLAVELSAQLLPEGYVAVRRDWLQSEVDNCRYCDGLNLEESDSDNPLGAGPCRGCAEARAALRTPTEGEGT